MSQRKIIFLPILIIIFGTFVWSLTMFRSGSLYSYGIGFWGPNGHDGIWHLSLINQLQTNIPPQNPVFSGTNLTNYHWGFDLFAAILINISHLEVSLVYFKILPILISLAIGILSYQLIRSNTKDHVLASFFVLFTFFSGSLGWIYTLIKSKQIGGESLFWSMQSVSTLINPPYAFSLVILLLGLLLWFKNKNGHKYPIAIINGLLFGILAGIKVYSGIIIGLTLVAVWFIDFLKSKKILNYSFITWITTLITSVIILYSLGVIKGSSMIEFHPFWFCHSMIESIDKFYLPKLASYRSSLSENLNLIKFPLFILIETVLFAIFLFGNMGFRVLGFFPVFSKIKKRKLTEIDKMFLIFMFFSLIIPLFFIQKGTAWNTIQFFYYFLFASNFFLAQFTTQLYHQKKHLIIISIIIISNIGSWGTIKDYLGNPPPAAISKNEVDALNFLKKQPNGYVLTYPYNKYLKQEKQISTPIPIYMYETTAYVSAFSKKSTYLEDEMNLDITGFNWQDRLSQSKEFFSTTDKFLGRGFLVNNQIDYIYLIDDQELSLKQTDIQADLIFDNNKVKIYQVQR